jgi:hypothetical protein
LTKDDFIPSGIPGGLFQMLKLLVRRLAQKKTWQIH